MTRREIVQAQKHLRAENRRFSRTFDQVDTGEPLLPGMIRVLRSRDYLVQVFEEVGGIIRLTVCRTEIDANGHWRADIPWEELQRIKCEVGFADRDAVEVFPKIKDVVNVANMRHLWIVPETMVPFAWRSKST
jgi:hypothetical protein